MKMYRVVIPYFHEFFVEAESKEEAKKKAFETTNGKIMGRDDKSIEIEEI